VSADKSKRQPKIEIVRWRFKTSADVLNFLRTFRIFSERPYIPPTTASKLPNTAIFQRNFLPAGCSGGNPVEVRYFRRFFARAAEKNAQPPTNFRCLKLNFLSGRQIKCAGEYLVLRRKDPPAGIGTAEAVDAATESAKNLQRSWT
jgi:hypothetical protein